MTIWCAGLDETHPNLYTKWSSIQSVADHLVHSFIRFAGASYAWYVNVCSGTVGDK